VRWVHSCVIHRENEQVKSELALTGTGREGQVVLAHFDGIVIIVREHRKVCTGSVSSPSGYEAPYAQYWPGTMLSGSAIVPSKTVLSLLLDA
jgi:hypothetical protein